MQREKKLVQGVAGWLVLGLLVAGAADAKNKRERRAAKLPATDLAAYPVLYIEDFPVTDPKADKRKRRENIGTVSARLPELIRQKLPEGVFERVERGEVPAGQGAVVLAAEITQYKEGSRFGRAMMAGVGSAHLDLTVRLRDAVSGTELIHFPIERTWSFGGALGASHGIEEMERNVATELALYLARCRGREAAAEAAGR